MTIVVDGATSSVNRSGSNIKQIYIGSIKAWEIPLPPITGTTFIERGELFNEDYLAQQQDSAGNMIPGFSPIFKRTYLSPGPDAIDISDASNGTVMLENGQWYSRYTEVCLNMSCVKMFKGSKYTEEVRLTGLDSTRLTDTRQMFEGMESVRLIDLSETNTTLVQYMTGMFNVAPSQATKCEVKYGPKFVHSRVSGLSEVTLNATMNMFTGRNNTMAKPWIGSPGQWLTLPDKPDSWYYYAPL